MGQKDAYGIVSSVDYTVCPDLPVQKLMITFPEAVQWLKSLIQPCTSWAGLSLHKPIDWNRRNQIKDNETSLLDFRNYLFARQCALLVLLKKPAELIQRALDYLHNTVQEIKSLEVWDSSLLYEPP